MRSDTATLTPRARAALTDRRRAEQAAQQIRLHGGLGQPPAAGADGEPAPAARARDGRRGLRVAEEPRRREPMPGARPALLATAATMALPRLDAQDRLAAAPVLRALAWQPHTALAALVDLTGGRVWIQRTDPPASCDCDHGCQQAPAALALPGAPRRSPEPVSVDGDGRLVLSAGLRAAAGAPPRGQLLLAPLVERHALLVCSPAALLQQALDPADDGDGEPGRSPARSDDHDRDDHDRDDHDRRELA